MALNVTDAAAIPKITDLFLFREQQDGERPPVEAGAAMLALIAREEFPGWALAFYEPLSTAGREQPAPPRLALLAADAILLAPIPVAGGWSGFLIAEETAAGQVRPFRLAGEAEPSCWLAVPAAESGVAVWAEEAAFLSTRQSPDTPD